MTVTLLWIPEWIIAAGERRGEHQPLNRSERLLRIKHEGRHRRAGIRQVAIRRQLQSRRAIKRRIPRRQRDDDPPSWLIGVRDDANGPAADWRWRRGRHILRRAPDLDAGDADAAIPLRHSRAPVSAGNGISLRRRLRREVEQIVDHGVALSAAACAALAATFHAPNC